MAPLVFFVMKCTSLCEMDYGLLIICLPRGIWRGVGISVGGHKESQSVPLLGCESGPGVLAGRRGGVSPFAGVGSGLLSPRLPEDPWWCAFGAGACQKDPTRTRAGNGVWIVNYKLVAESSYLSCLWATLQGICIGLYLKFPNEGIRNSRVLSSR